MFIQNSIVSTFAGRFYRNPLGDTLSFEDCSKVVVCTRTLPARMFASAASCRVLQILYFDASHERQLMIVILYRVQPHCGVDSKQILPSVLVLGFGSIYDGRLDMDNSQIEAHLTRQGRHLESGSDSQASETVE